ncbi:hypothetical protein Ddye_008672 [Dipteronia dyeriana]|uniref:Myb/SANT-like domain-containing protein n=1 Tax=Dipteronia dyeriana TaxID=168575 RepID=A0AAD9X9Y0_9ROSI|nr:hypothetical protein Ddye_008672 [Dipteronia dyeriana]
MESGQWYIQTRLLTTNKKMMCDKIPSCGLRAQPHIDSRIKLLKKQYHAISEMLGPSASGFGWNDDLKCVVIGKMCLIKGTIGFSETVEEIGDEDDQHNDFDPFYPSNELNGNVNGSSTSTPLTQSRKKDSVKEFGNKQTASSDSIKRLADCFKFEANGATRRMKVFDELKKIGGMTNAQRVKVGQLLVHDQANIDYFFTLDEEFKLDFLLSLLE